MKSVKAQRGLSLSSMLVMLFLAVVASMLGMRLLPHYMDFYTLQRIVTASAAERTFNVRTADDFVRYVDKSLMINNIRDIDVTDVMSVQIERGDVLVSLDYERREHLFGNVDVVLSFDREYRLLVQ